MAGKALGKQIAIDTCQLSLVLADFYIAAETIELHIQNLADAHKQRIQHLRKLGFRRATGIAGLAYDKLIRRLDI